MNQSRLRYLEAQMRAEVGHELLALVRALPAPQRATALTTQMAALDAATRERVYPLLSEDELDLLMPGMTAYVRSLTDDELRALDRDERAARRALTTIRRQAKGDGHAPA